MNPQRIVEMYMTALLGANLDDVHLKKVAEVNRYILSTGKETDQPELGV